MKKRKLSATTEHGTFTRTTASPYAFVGVYRNARSDGNGNATTPWTYVARWSKSSFGADRLAREYVGDHGAGYLIIEFVGVYPVDGAAVAGA